VIQIGLALLAIAALLGITVAAAVTLGLVCPVRRHRPICRVEWRLVAGGEVGTAALLRSGLPRKPLVPRTLRRMSDIGQEATLLGYSAFALGMALSALTRHSLGARFAWGRTTDR
jgi:hypothetical protein